MIGFIFPGQGSQHKGMGGTLFEEFDEHTAQADIILGYSIKQVCKEDPNSLLNQTQYTQPALYVVNALAYLKKVKESGRRPDFVAGHSLGEYNALFSAGVFDFTTGLRLVKMRGELMSKATDGGMAAVLGFPLHRVKHVLMENRLNGIDIANDNSPDQIVIAGPKKDLEQARPIFEEAGIRAYIPLKVSGAFHSRYMENAMKQFEAYLQEISFSNMTLPVLANVNARPYKQEDIKQNLIRQITHTVKWTDTIRYLMRYKDMDFEEVGPGKILTKLVAAIRRSEKSLVIEPEGADVKKIGTGEWHDTAPETADMMITTENETTIALQNIERAGVVPVHGPPISIPVQRGKRRSITGESLGDEAFKKDYNLKYAYVTGAMYQGIASEHLVIQVGKAGMLGFYGTGGLKPDQIEKAIRTIQGALKQGEAYGMNLLQGNQLLEEQIVDLFLQYGVTTIEASAYMMVTSALVRYRAKGLKPTPAGDVHIGHRIIAKVSRPEVAEAFLSPAPERIVAKLLQDNLITDKAAQMLRNIPMADDISIEADSGGHTDQGVAFVLLPAMLRLRDKMMAAHGYKKKIRIGAAGGIGTPESAGAAFMLGADYIVTGSINQCTVEAKTSDTVKNLLQDINVQDTAYAPAGDMFEMGARVQVIKKGVFFPARANKLYDLYRQHDSLEEIDEKTRRILQERYFNRSFDEVYREVKAYVHPREIEKAERNPKHKMALIFKWYFGYSTQLALCNDQEHTIDYQIHCGPALGAFNRWVMGTPLENWRERHVDMIGEMLMRETAHLLNQRIAKLMGL